MTGRKSNISEGHFEGAMKDVLTRKAIGTEEYRSAVESLAGGNKIAICRVRSSHA